MNADLYVRRARMNMSLNRNDMALRDLRFAYELDSKAQRTLMYLGDLYLKMNDATRALFYYDSVIKINPESDDAYARKASAFAVLKQPEEALAAFDSAIKVSKYKPERFWLGKADMLRKFGRLEESRNAYVKARTEDPKLQEAWRGEASVCRLLNDEKGWRSALLTYVELAPTDVNAKKELAEVLAN
jgi:tetratricopeptide (TPR) repeat protein